MDERAKDILRRAGYQIGQPTGGTPPKEVVSKVEEMWGEYQKLEPSSGIRRIELWKFVQSLKDKTPDEFGGWLIAQEIEAKSKIVRAIDLWNYTVEGDLELVRLIRREIEEGKWKIKE